MSSYINMENVTKELSGNIVLNNINLSLEKRKVYGLKGKNGSGKTMLFRAICGFIKTQGTITVGGKRVGVDGYYAENVGVLLENPGFLPNYSGFKNLKYLAEINNKIDDMHIKATMIAVGLDPEEKKAFKKYSLGMKQKLGIAQAIMENPEVIILDEFINALDEDSVKKINNIIIELRNKDKLILVSNHNNEELEGICDEIYTINNGEICSKKVMRGISDENEK
ncbi:ATP-binding cassette domain-containing protein [Clostridium senegalense]|uniref:ATP-binding cassette domain-containing protein n=1 Tax=Clostridium senegalense TaxID=1465809 RepID=A0A6M0H6E1_9CLOT|nr:ATP-binding cassette domain-containing protein [Clostridium senegalense]NEU06209.1 ATP-binding cassette domain-containing protein [Clostridium senegalense]